MLRKDLSSLNSARNVLLKSIRENYPEYSEISSPSPVSKTELDRLLSRNQAVLVYRIDESDSYLWSLSTERGVTAYRLPIGYRELKAKSGIDSAVGRSRPFDDSRGYPRVQLRAFIRAVQDSHRTCTGLAQYR